MRLMLVSLMIREETQQNMCQGKFSIFINNLN